MRATLVLPFLTVAVCGQTIVTAPAGFETANGPSSVLYPWSFTNSAQFRYQEVHTTLVNRALPNIRAVNFRRDETASAVTTAVARTMNVEFRLGHGDIGRFACKFGENYVAPATVAYVRKPTNLPDWTMRTGTGAAEPWTLRLPLDVMWSYNGTNHLVWEVVWDQSTATGTYNTDRTTGTGAIFTSTAGAAIGTGCTATGRTAAFSLTTTGFTHLTNGLMRLRLSATNAPDNAPISLMADAVNSNLSVPGVCATVVALPVLQVPVGTSAVGGALAAQDLHLPWLPVLQTAPIFLQLLTVDLGQPGLPVALSQGRSQQWPAVTATPSAMAYIYQTDISGAALGNGPFVAGSAICGLEQ